MTIEVGEINQSTDKNDTGLHLLPHHLDHLINSAISIEFIRQRGYQTIEDRKHLEAIGFKKQQCRVPGILIPIYGVNGDGIVSYQFRPDSPRLNNRGKPIKYETPAGTINRIDCPLSCHEKLADPSEILYITEGLKKADAIASQGVCVVAITGVWNWKAKNRFGGTTISPDFDHIALNGRTVFLIPDSDYAINPVGLVHSFNLVIINFETT